MSRRVMCLAMCAGASVACTAPSDTPSRETAETGVPLPPETGDTSTEEPSTATWMAQEIPPGRDDIALKDLLLPGNFNSSSYACAGANGMSPDAPTVVQSLWEGLDEDTGGGGLNRRRIVDWSKTTDRSLGEQLRDGIRVLDIRFTNKDGVLTTWHSVYGHPLEEDLDQVVTFAASHPSEMILLTFGLAVDEADWPTFADALAAPRADGVSLCDLSFNSDTPAATATLADVRAAGRNLVWSPRGDLKAFFDGRGDCPSATVEIDGQGSLSTTTEAVVSKLEASVATRAADVFLQNDFFFYLGQQGDVEQVGTLSQYASFEEAVAAKGYAGDFPARMIERFDVDGKMNIFTGGYVENTDLVAAVIERTRER